MTTNEKYNWKNVQRWIDAWTCLKTREIRQSRFTKQMSQLCLILLAPSFRCHPSLGFPLGPFGPSPLYRFNGPSDVQTRGGATDGRTNRREETKDSERNEPRGGKSEAHYFTGANAENYGTRVR